MGQEADPPPVPRPRDRPVEDGHVYAPPVLPVGAYHLYEPACDRSDEAAVWRPDGLTVRIGDASDLLCLAAGEIHHEHLRLLDRAPRPLRAAAERGGTPDHTQGDSDPRWARRDQKTGDSV